MEIEGNFTNYNYDIDDSDDDAPSYMLQKVFDFKCQRNDIQFKNKKLEPT